MLDPNLVQETIQDIQEVKEKILQRHEGDTTFSLRVDTVFNQLINSLGNTSGHVVPTQKETSFTPQPLTNVAGQKITVATNGPLKLPTIEVDAKESFKEEIKLIHDGFLKRENLELLESLREIQLRGVAKIAGVENYDTDRIDGAFIQNIKSKIEANEADKVNRNQARLDLNKDAGKVVDNKKVTDKPKQPAADKSENPVK